ncbi:M23 family metallopeptidase [Streptomyces sp. NPDC089919]|uniref:M23 family metallopeptidase n=1 Tax=Streptomyces sp. NPDC089919 TaxID=3155188 RepID=UPI00342204A2
MASNQPAPEAAEQLQGPSGAPAAAGAWGEWNPTEDSVRPVAGRHRVAKQRGGLARSSTVLGVGIIAAVGAAGMATAQDKPPVAISMPSLLPDLDDGAEAPAAGRVAVDAPLTTAGATPEQAAAGTDAGEALRHRILQQAESQADAAAAEAKDAARREAEEAAAARAKAQQEAARKAAEAAAKAAAAAKAEAARLAQLAKSYVLPTSAYTLTSHYGDSGSMWSSGHHTGLDFAAPTGTPVKAVHGGTVVSAGWSGPYGYRIVLRLADGTELWYCHLSSMSVTSGTVTTGETIGRVGATGNVTGAHLHLEVREGGSTVDPLSWLAARGLNA